MRFIEQWIGSLWNMGKCFIPFLLYVFILELENLEGYLFHYTWPPPGTASQDTFMFILIRGKDLGLSFT